MLLIKEGTDIDHQTVGLAHRFECLRVLIYDLPLLKHMLPIEVDQACLERKCICLRNNCYYQSNHYNDVFEDLLEAFSDICFGAGIHCWREENFLYKILDHDEVDESIGVEENL